MQAPLIIGRPRYCDTDIEVYDTACPGCRERLTWAVETPPIPMTFFSWFTADCEKRIEFCPNCDEELPAGDLTKAEAAA